MPQNPGFRDDIGACILRIGFGLPYSSTFSNKEPNNITEESIESIVTVRSKRGVERVTWLRVRLCPCDHRETAEAPRESRG